MHPYLNALTRLLTPCLNTLPSRLGNTLGKIEHPQQPIRIEYYVTRVVSQSESSIMSPESSRLGVKTLLGSSRLAVAYLNTSGHHPPPPTTSAHTLTTNLYMQTISPSPETQVMFNEAIRKGFSLSFESWTSDKKLVSTSKLFQHYIGLSANISSPLFFN